MQNRTIMMPLEDTISEVNQQPEVVDKALRNNRTKIVELAQILSKNEIETIHIVGAGDSMFLGQCVKEAFHLYSGLPLAVIQAYEYAVYGELAIQQRTALFVISSSGRISTTRDALVRALHTNAFVVGVTDNPSQDNPFYTEPEFVLIPGGIKNGWPTQTTTASIAVFISLAIELGRLRGHLESADADQLLAKLSDMPKLMQETISKTRTKMCQIAEKFVNTETLYFIGSGPGYGVANIGGAVMAEGPQKIGVPLHVEEFHHSLRVNTVGLDMPVFLIAPKDPAYQRYLDTVDSIKKWGGYLIAIIGEHDELISKEANAFVQIPEVPYPMSPLLSVLPLHLFSIEITDYLVRIGYQRPWKSN